MLVLKLSHFFTRLYGKGNWAGISKLTYIRTPSSRSYIVLALEKIDLTAPSNSGFLGFDVLCCTCYFLKKISKQFCGHKRVSSRGQHGKSVAKITGSTCAHFKISQFLK